MGATLQDTLKEYAQLAAQKSTLAPSAGPPVIGGGPPQAQPPGQPSSQGPTPPPAPAPSGGPSGSPSGGQAQPTGIFQSIAKGFNTFMTQPKEKNDQAIEGALAAIPAAVARAPSFLAGGLMDTAADAGKFIDDAVYGSMARSGVPGVQDLGKAGLQGSHRAQAAEGAVVGQYTHGASLADTLSARQSVGQVGNPAVNEFLTQAVATVLPVGEAKTAVQAATHLAAKAFATANPNTGDAEGNLLDRSTQAAEAVTLDGVFHALGNVSKLVSQSGKVVPATAEEAAADSLDRDFAAKRTADARQAQANAQAGLGHGEAPLEGAASRRGDVPPAAGGEPSQHPIAADANAALEAAGAGERLPAEGPQLTPDGKIVVSPASKDAVDAQGMGRSFVSSEDALSAPPPSALEGPLKESRLGTTAKDAADQDKGAVPASADSDANHTIYKEVDDNGGQRVVGSLSQAEMNDHLAAARWYAEHPDEINTDPSHLAGQMNLRPLGSSDEVSALGRAMADRIGEENPGLRRPVTHAEILTAAAEGGWETPQDAIIAANQFADKTANDAVSVTQLRLMQARLNKAMAELHGTDWTSVPLDDPRWEGALTAYHNSYSFMQSFRSAKSNIARSLNAIGMDLNGPMARLVFGMKPEDVYDPQAVPDFYAWRNAFGRTPEDALQPRDPANPNPLPRTPQEFADQIVLHALATQAGPDALNAYWKGLSLAPDALTHLRQSVASFFTAALVSSPATFARDLIGPAVLSGFRTFEKSSGALMQAIQDSVLGDGSKVADYLADSGNAWKAYGQTFGDVLQSLRYGYDTALSGESRLGGAQPYNFASHGVPQALLDKLNLSPVDQALYAAGNLILKFPDAVHRLHGGVNEAALRLSYLGEIRAAALMQASEQGLSGDALNAYVKQAVMSAEDPLSGQATDVTQLENAQRTTFTKRVTDPQSQPMMNTVLEALQAVRSNVPETKLVLPILNVPANNLGETLRRIPVLGQLMRGTQADLSGSMGKIAQAEAYGRMLSGAGVLGAGFMLSRAGLLTGAGPSNPRDNQTWQAAGFQPWSIKGPDGRWYSFNRIDGLGSLLGIMAGMHDETVYHAQDNPNLAYSAVSALAEYFKDQASLKGISDLLNFGGDPSQDANHFGRMVNGIAAGFVPRFITTLRELGDQDKRVVHSPWEAILNALPGASKTLDPTRNLFGDAVHIARSADNTLPITTSPVNPNGPDEPVLSELHRLFLATGYLPGVLPPALVGAHADMRDVKLEDGHSLYDARMRYRGLVTDDDGQTLKQALTALINSDDYKSGFDGRPRGAASVDSGDGEKMNRGDMLSKVFSEYDRRASQAVAKDSQIATSWLVAQKLKQSNPPGASTIPTGHIATNPAVADSLMRALGGSSMQDYVDKVQGN